ncbi:hypothetical protein GCM10009557_09480 [Virgisporangium ochraceum]|uniref:Uncharacterized protein n=1 Tax=Virgisporangium ochraceum TaxID=65505 RepID=A0A8J3ZY78_9ACTN|nr:hypothetical protein Voc01_063200 [Virgisporangium ochraceum]
MPGRADVEVVGQLVGEHSAVGVGEDELAFDGQQQPSPLAATVVGVDKERGQAQRGGAPPELGIERLGRRQSFAEDAAAASGARRGARGVVRGRAARVRRRAHRLGRAPDPLH